MLQFVSPLTPQSFAFNKAIKKLVEAQLDWYLAHRGGPGDGFTLTSTVGVLKGDGENETWDEMLSNVVSISFTRNFRGSGKKSIVSHTFGFNWVLGKERTLKVSDIFDPKTNWEKAVAHFTDKTWGGQKIPDSAVMKAVEDTSRWTLERGGITFFFTDESSNTIPWSTLKPYLNKNGLIHALNGEGFAQ